MRVQAAPGVNVPVEHKPRDYITAADPVDVPDTAYYRRRITDGDLVLVNDPAPVPAATKQHKEVA